VPLALLCLEMKTTKPKWAKWFGRFCAFIVSSFKVTKWTFFPLISAE
jgi:hypothetical protein